MLLGVWLIVATVVVRADDGASITERPVMISGNGGTSLEGTLELPARAATAKVPGLVLLSGSGPTDRDGNQPPAFMTDLLKQIAAGLANHGIATLRFDKRGMDANASELPPDQSLYGAFFTWENFVGDTVAAGRFLRQQPEIDPARIGFLGHSEGGILSLDAAQALRSDGHPIAALILIGAPGRTIDAIVSDQLRALLKRQGAPPPQTEYFLKQNRQVIDYIRANGRVPFNMPQGLAPIYPPYLGMFLQSELAEDPCKLVAAFSGPVLVINGAFDAQVSPTLDTALLEAALKSRKNDDHTVIIALDASHNLKSVQSVDDPGITGPVIPAILDQLTAWAARKLGTNGAAKNN